MKVEEVPVSDVRPYERNPRHNEAAVDAVAASVAEFGWQQPIVVDKDGVIVVGHTRYQAALKIGLRTVPVVVADGLTPDQVRAYRLADNRTGELATWDDALLVEELGALDGWDMSAFGFEDVARGLGDEDAPREDGRVEIATELDERKEYVVIRIDTDVDWAQAQTVFGLRKKQRWSTNRKGTGGGDARVCRVVTWQEFAERFL